MSIGCVIEARLREEIPPGVKNIQRFRTAHVTSSLILSTSMIVGFKGQLLRMHEKGNVRSDLYECV